MRRRTFLGNSVMALSMGLAFGNSVFAAGSKKVFLDYTQSELDDAYNQDVWAHPNFREKIAEFSSSSAEVKSKYSFITARYGSGKAEVMDIFTSKQSSPAPIHVFIHGGGWKILSKDESAGAAPTFVDAGGIYIAVNFDNIPATTLGGMVEQCRAALVWIYQHAAEFGGDARNITLSGHSSGAHLAAVMLATDWQGYGVPADLLKGGVLISGMCDLTAPMLSSRSEYLKLNSKQIFEYSPINHLANINCPVYLAWGTDESPEFIRQSKYFARRLNAAGRLYGSDELKGMDHFDAALQLNDPLSVVSKNALALMKGATVSPS